MMVALLNHCSIEPGQFSASISFSLIALFMPLLNSSISEHSSYSLSFATLLKSYMNSSIVLLSCSILFNSAIFIDSLSPPSNSLLISTKNFPTNSNSNSPVSNPSNIFYFQISANPPCTQDRTHWICSSSAISLNFIFIYNLHAVTEPETFDEVLSNTCGFATSVLTAIPSPTPLALPANYTVNVSTYS